MFKEITKKMMLDELRSSPIYIVLIAMIVLSLVVYLLGESYTDSALLFGVFVLILGSIVFYVSLLRKNNKKQ